MFKLKATILLFLVASAALVAQSQVSIVSIGGGSTVSASCGVSPGSGPGTIVVSETVNAQTGTTYTVAATDCQRLLTLSNSSTVAVTVPAAGGSFPNGFKFSVKNKGSGAATLTPASGTIGGASALTLTTGQGCDVTSDGTNWQTQCGAGSSSLLTDPSIGTGYISETFTVGTGGVTAFTLVTKDTSNPAKVIAATGSGAYGVALSTATSGGTVEVARWGQVQLLTDNAVTAGDLAIPGTSTVTYGRDSGQTASSAIPIATRVIGSWRTSASAGSTALIELSPDHFGTQVSGTGATAAYLLTDFSLTKTSSTVATVNGSASSTAPVNIRFGTTIYSFTSSATATISGTSDTGNVYFCVSAAGALEVKHNQAFTLTGSGLTVVTGQTSCGVDTPIWTGHVTANVLDAITEAMDHRPWLSGDVPINCGTGLVVNGHGCAIDTSVVPTYASTTYTVGHMVTVSSTSPLVVTDGGAPGGGSSIISHAPVFDSSDHNNTATTSQQTLNTLTIPASSMTTTTGSWIKISLSGSYTESGDPVVLVFGSTSIAILGGNTAGATRIEITCDVYVTGTNAEKFRCVSGIGQNTAVPFVDYTTATEVLSSSVAVAFKVTTSASANVWTLKDFTVQWMN